MTRCNSGLAYLLLMLLLLIGCSPDEESEQAGSGQLNAAQSSSSVATAGQDGSGAASSGIFVEVTESADLDFRHRNGGTGKKYLPEIMGSGGSVLDFDGDGFMDVYLVQSGAFPGNGDAPGVSNRLFRNLGNGVFEDITEAAGAGDTGYGMGSAAADYDNDGDPDLYVVNFGRNVMLRNNGDGTFTDVTSDAGVGDPAWGSSASFLDANGDGWLDLFVVNYLEFSVATHVDCGTPSKGILSYCSPDVYPSAPDVFYLGSSGGQFREMTAASGLTETTGKGLGAVAQDLTGDGWPDIYVANDSTPNFLFVNNGGGVFEEQGIALGVSHNEEGMTEAGMGTDAGDLNGDGRPDILVTNLSQETNALYLGGEGFFSYATRRAGLYAPSYPLVGFGTDFLDVDRDGDLDLVVANGHVIDNISLIDDSQQFAQPGQLFLNDGSGKLALLDAPRAGDISQPVVGRGTLTLDYDNDGRLDLLVTANNGPARLYQNVSDDPGNWIGVMLLPDGGNRDAVGARVGVTADGRTQVQEKKIGSSYQTSSDPRLHFGLGDAQTADIVVHWPGGQPVNYPALSAGRYYRLSQSGQVD